MSMIQDFKEFAVKGNVPRARRTIRGVDAIVRRVHRGPLHEPCGLIGIGPDDGSYTGFEVIE